MLIENFDVETDTFFRGKSVHVAADGIDLAGDGFSGPVSGPFKYHVLDEMRDAVPFGIFVARAGFQPDTDRNRAEVRHLLGDDGQAVLQRAPMNIASFF